MKGDYKTHFRGDGQGSKQTLCGLNIAQAHGDLPLVATRPSACTCRNCITKYYFHNPLHLKRTKTRQAVAR